MRPIPERLARALERPLAIAWKDLLVLGKGASPWKGAFAALVALLPLLTLAAVSVYVPGPWRHGGRAALLATAAVFSALAFLVAVPAATSLALERDRETLQGLVVSPASPFDLILGKLLAALGNALWIKALALPTLAIAWTLGGADVGFLPRYLAVLFAADLSFASFALWASARPLRPPRLGSSAVKIGVSQAQLALQRSVGVVVLVSLVPIYGALFAVPLALQHGLKLARILDAAAALGAVHPLFTLVAWGDARVFGARLPVWALAVAFHLLAAIPFLAAAAEAQRAPGAPRGRAARAGYLAFLVYVAAMATGATWEAGLDVRTLVGGGFAAALVVLGAGAVSDAPPPRSPFGLGAVLRAFVDPRAALLSSAETAPGFAFLGALAAAPFVLLSAGELSAGLRACAGMATCAVGIAAAGARLAARAQARETAAFERALARRQETPGASPPRGEGTETAPDEPATGSGTALGILSLLVLAGPIIAYAGVELARRLPQVAPLAPAFRALGILAVAANPLASLQPLARGAPATVIEAGATGLLGVEASTLGLLHLALWGTVLAVALATLPRAPRPKAPG